jgi:ABC-2 type transport system permease protein
MRDGKTGGAGALARLWALVLKELRQIGRNRPLIASLIVPPTLQIIIFGFALNPTVDGLRLGVVDHSRSAQSRDLVAAFTANGTFTLRDQYAGVGGLERALHRGDLDAGLVIPPDFSRDRLRPPTGDGARVQILLNAVNANTANIAQGYAGGIIEAFNRDRAGRRAPAPQVRSRIALLYNPGLESSWFILTGTFGILLILNGSLVAATSTVREKEKGTIEQLLMTPADAGEVILAKMAPLFALLMLDVLLVIVVGGLVFGVPVRGSLGLLLFAGGLCVLVGIGIGTTIATYTKTGLQAQLLTFFINPPLALLSGATTPVEAMPPWVQPLTLLNPIRHFGEIARAVMIKGAGVEAVWPNLLALSAFALALVFLSVRRFREQLS